MLGGITFEKSGNGSLCFSIEEISEDLKSEIRSRLSAICNGAAKASKNTVLYSYKSTLNSFFEKFDTKSADTQKGMIGELLAHILFLHYETDFRAASAHFNLEEDSIKKGFDLVLHHGATKEMWFVEVKAGECGEQTSIQKLGSLLSIAKTDLRDNLNSERHTLWQNAINSATVVNDQSDLKDQIVALLESYNEKAVSGASASTDYNAVLVAVCFAGTNNFASADEFELRHTTQKDKGEFRELMSVALQKDTIESVIQFLKDEVADG